LEIKGIISGDVGGGKNMMIADSRQLLIASDQGISLVDFKNGDTQRFWVLENQEQYTEFVLNLSPDSEQLLVYAGPTWAQTTAVYWLDLQN
jgi:hypothetical protein